MSRALLPALVALACACGGAGFNETAARYGHAEETAATQAIPLGTVAYTLCRKQAEYVYLGELLGLRAPEAVTGEPWTKWYGMAEARPGPNGASVSWQTQCLEWAGAGAVVTQFLRTLRAHARAIAAVAEGKDFDGSGVAKLDDALATAGGKLVTAGGTYVAAAKNASGALGSVTGKVVDLVREKKLEDTVADSDACMQGAFAKLKDVGSALAGKLQEIEKDHDRIVLRVSKVRGERSYAAAVALGDAFDVVGDDEVELDRLRTALVAYLAAIDQLRDAHHRLALLADGKAKSEEVAQALGALEATEETLLELEK